MKGTGIEWTDETWNPIRGCSVLSKGCQECYAMHVAHRFNGAGQPYEGLTRMTTKGPRWNGKIRLVPEKLDQPLRWRRRRKVFVNSMSDLFHEGVPDAFIDSVFAVMALAKEHTFQVLTKRPDRMCEYLSADPAELLFRWAQAIPHNWMSDTNFDIVHSNTEFPLANVWLLTSVEDQKAADERVPHLLQTPAAVRGLSMEPLLGPITLHDAWLFPEVERRPGFPVCGRGARIDWIIVGGESGAKARPMRPDWARSLRDQCTAARIPYFFKQHGEFVFLRERAATWCVSLEDADARLKTHPAKGDFSGKDVIYRVGKKNAGRLLDGLEWSEYPGQSESVAQQP